MSLGDQVGRLVNAIAMHEDRAVAEIIRQRDKALSDLAEMTSSRDWFSGRYSDSRKTRELLERKNAALRGVITRMKAKSK